MAAFMHFWRMTEPRQYFDLDADELTAMERHMDRVAEANRKGR
jgi:hypothetical protein